MMALAGLTSCKVEAADRSECEQMLSTAETVFVATEMQAGEAAAEGAAAEGAAEGTDPSAPDEAVNAIAVADILDHQKEALLKKCQAQSRTYVACARDKRHLDHDECEKHLRKGAPRLMVSAKLRDQDATRLFQAVKAGVSEAGEARLKLWLQTCAAIPGCSGTCKKALLASASESGKEMVAKQAADLGKCSEWVKFSKEHQGDALRKRIESFVAGRLDHLLPELRRRLAEPQRRDLAAAIARGALRPRP